MQTLIIMIGELLTNGVFHLFLIIFIGFLIFLFLLERTEKTEPSKEIELFEYGASPRFLSPAEHSFFLVLKKVLSSEYEIFAQVRMADVLYPKYPRYTRERQVAFNKISSKHFDYLICDKQTLLIVAAIELDDKSHQKNNRQNRDYFVENACRSAGLKLIRFPCKSDYQLAAVREQIINEVKFDNEA